ncbi:DMP19 family protein [Flagellimonas flava]|uniref:DMP19 family protein n=1 Tax=Flagellimonas flava TaxID=570519 RepID=UPI003D64DFBB
MTKEELIDYVYFDIAGEYLNQRMEDWSQTQKWYNTVFELSVPVRYTYCIGILNTQVMNGGFEQYYDNYYGIFAEETLKGLKEIGASLTHQLVLTSTEILKKHMSPGVDLFTFITSNEHWDNKEIVDAFNRLSNEYFDLEDKEDLTELLGTYLQNCEIS